MKHAAEQTFLSRSFIPTRCAAKGRQRTLIDNPTAVLPISTHAWCARKRILPHPRSAEYVPRSKAKSCVQPSASSLLGGASPASAREGWAEYGGRQLI